MSNPEGINQYGRGKDAGKTAARLGGAKYNKALTASASRAATSGKNPTPRNIARYEHSKSVVNKMYAGRSRPPSIGRNTIIGWGR